MFTGEIPLSKISVYFISQALALFRSFSNKDLHEILFRRTLFYPVISFVCDTLSHVNRSVSCMKGLPTTNYKVTPVLTRPHFLRRVCMSCSLCYYQRFFLQHRYMYCTGWSLSYLSITNCSTTLLFGFYFVFGFF